MVSRKPHKRDLTLWISTRARWCICARPVRVLLTSGEKSRAGASFSAVPYSRDPVSVSFHLTAFRRQARSPTTSLSMPSLLEGLSYKSRGIFIVLISRKHDEPNPKLVQHHEHQGIIGYESSFIKIDLANNCLGDRKDLEDLKKSIVRCDEGESCFKKKNRHIHCSLLQKIEVLQL